MTDEKQIVIAALNKLQDFIIYGCSARDEDMRDSLRLLEEIRIFILTLPTITVCHGTLKKGDDIFKVQMENMSFSKISNDEA